MLPCKDLTTVSFASNQKLMRRRHLFLLFTITAALFFNPVLLRVSAQDSTIHLSMSEAIQAKQGLIQKSDLLNAQVQQTTIENSVAKAKSNIRNVSNYLSLLMGLKNGVIYTADVKGQYSCIQRHTSHRVPG